jgi:hypothetical protein
MNRGTAAEVDVAGIMAGLTATRPDPTDAPAVSAWMLRVLGVLHSPVYRSRELRARFAAHGVTEPMAVYLAERSAPMGPVGPLVVASAFYGFSPTALAVHLPAVWDQVPAPRVVELTLEAMRELLDRVLGLTADPGSEPSESLRTVEELAALLGPVAEAHPTAGRPLAAAWATLPPVGEPMLDLWLATCVIRESRGDGHIAVLVSEGIGPLESHLVTYGDVAERRPALQSLRGWTPDEIDAAAEGLRDRGLLEPDGRRTDRARELRRHIEVRTDAISATAWSEAGPGSVGRIGELALRLLPSVLVSGTLLQPVIDLLTPRR